MKPLKKLNDGVIGNEIAKGTSDQQTVRRSRNNIQMVTNVLLVWLDTNIEENSPDCCHAINQLQSVFNNISILKDINECLEFLQRMDNEKICIIISGQLGQDLMPCIHNMSQVDSIFIFCTDKTYHEEWTEEWFKIKGIFTEITDICDALKQSIQQCEQNVTSISFIDTSSDISQKKLDQLDPSFMYTQILKEILLSIEFEEKHLTELVEYGLITFEDNDKELTNIKKLERQYYDKKPIWWYTYECFLYPMVNRALRVLDGGIIMKLGFFIKDLHRDIEQLYKEQFGHSDANEILTLYRGQGLTKDDFKKMKETIGGLLSFNCFLSTSKKRTVSLRFAHSALKNPDLVAILFVITIDPSKSPTPFASIGNVSYFRGEDEILFSMHTVFRIDHITTMNDNDRLYEVNLSLSSDSDKDLSVLSNRIRQEVESLSGWEQLGELLLRIGQPEKAQQVYETLLSQPVNDVAKARFYHQLGRAKHGLGEHKEAIELYEEVIKIYEEIFPPNHLNLAMTYNNMGNVYSNMGEYAKALSSHEKALEIRQQSLPSNHPHLAMSHNNIGVVYSDMGEYSKALLSHEKGLEISKQSLPSNHPDLATCHNNLGWVYCEMGQYPKALSEYLKGLEIYKQSLPSNHPVLANSYKNIGGVYCNMGEYSQALSSYEKALEIRQESLPSNHPDLAASYNDIGSLYFHISDYSKALSQYLKALEIRQRSLPIKHPDLAKSYNSIASVYLVMDEYSTAVSYYEKALEIQQHSLSSNHPSLAMTYNNLGEVYFKIGEYTKALSSHEKALEIKQQCLPSNHPDLAVSYMNIGNVHSNMGQYSQGVSCYEKALAIQQQLLPSNHPDLAMTYNNLGAVHETMKKYSKAHSFYEHAIEIAQKTLPSTHPHLKSYKNNFDRVKKRL